MLLRELKEKIMKLKSSHTISVYPEYEGQDGWFVEGAKTEQEAVEAMNSEYLFEDQDTYKVGDAEIKTLHRCLDCDMQWCHDGDYTCGECGEPRLSKKYIEVYYFNKQVK